MKRFRDSDGDIWTERSDGRYHHTNTAEGHTRNTTGEATRELRWIELHYGPLTDLGEAPEPALADALDRVSEHRKEVLGEALEIVKSVPRSLTGRDAVHYAAVKIIDAIAEA